MSAIDTKKLREVCVKAGEGTDIREKQRNADAFMCNVGPRQVIELLDAIEQRDRMLDEARAALDNYGHQSIRLIVREDEDPRMQMSFKGTPTISIYAGESLEIGSKARMTLAKLEEMKK